MIIIQKRDQPMIKSLLGALTLVNFFSFLAGYVYFGGDALNGKIEDGRFYLADHGKLTEVSEGIYRYSELHGLSVFLLIGVVMIVHFAQKTD